MPCGRIAIVVLTPEKLRATDLLQLIELIADFAQQCVLRELEKSTNKAVDEKRWKEPCMCIATYLMKDLSAAEAEKLIAVFWRNEGAGCKLEGRNCKVQVVRRELEGAESKGQVAG